MAASWVESTDGAVVGREAGGEWPVDPVEHASECAVTAGVEGQRLCKSEMREGALEQGDRLHR